MQPLELAGERQIAIKDRGVGDWVMHNCQKRKTAMLSRATAIGSMSVC